MPKKVIPLSDLQVNKAKPGAKNYKLTDGAGLYLMVTPLGGKLWRFDYQMAGKRKTLSIGSYPEISLAKAREKRAEARELVAAGGDPCKAKLIAKIERREQLANTFERLAREWHMHYIVDRAEKTRTNILARLERDMFPVIGGIPLSELTPRMILDGVLKPIENRGAVEVAHRCRNIISQILRYGVAIGACERDLTFDLRGALKGYKNKHLPALTDPAKVGALLRAIDGFDGSFIVRCALRLHPLVVTRPGELRHAEWSEFNLDAATWEIPAGRMKMKNPHVVPLSPQAVAILHELHALTGSGKYLFPSIRSTARPISDNTMNAALRRLGYTSDEMVSHGWRAVFRTLADEVLQAKIEVIELQLAHRVADPLGRAYNRTSFLKERREFMNKWGSYLDGLKAGAQVIPLKRGA
jgi:integrase